MMITYNKEFCFLGQFIRSNCSQENRLELPKITMGDTFCLSLYYIFSGHGNLSVYSNNTLLMYLTRFDAEIWTRAYFTLSKGIHNVSLVYSGGNITTLALDNVTTTAEKCPETGKLRKIYIVALDILGL